MRALLHERPEIRIDATWRVDLGDEIFIDLNFIQNSTHYHNPFNLLTMHITVTTETGKIINLNVQPDEEVRARHPKFLKYFFRLENYLKWCAYHRLF
jgi:hypothetical protein